MNKISFLEGFIILTVARKSGEYVVIGEDIVVKVISDDKGELQLEIDTPRGIEIIPGEMNKDTNHIPPQQLLSTLNDQGDKRQVIDKVAVWKENAIILLNPSIILYITIDKKKVVVHTRDDVYESGSSLDALELRLFSRGFFRSHKSFIVNMDYVEKIIPWFNSTYMMILKSAAEQIPVSRHYTKRLRNLLSI